MATNFVLSSSNSSDSSSSMDDDGGLSSRKVDLSFQNLDDETLDLNLASLADAPDTASRVERLLLYNNRLENVSVVITAFSNLSVLDLSNNLVRRLPEGLAFMTGLTQLFLRNNLIGDNDFPKSLESLRSLRDLNLSGNRLTTIPRAVLQIPTLRNLFVGGNRIEEVPAGIRALKRLRVLYLGGNRVRRLPPQICQLKHLHALILCDNLLESLPDCICDLQRLECLQLHGNRLTTIPYGLIQLESLSELSLRDNPLVVRFVREMTFQPSPLLELAARTVTIHRIPFREGDLPVHLHRYLHSSRRCVNPSCRGVFFNDKVEHVKFVDFCGKYKIPLLQYLCSSTCKADRPAVTATTAAPALQEEKMRRVLLG